MQTPSRAVPGDHPRSRGEYFAEPACQGFDLGSSPLSRGIRLCGHHSTLPRGIIPALAGNTECGTGSRPCPWDHPRSRGEYRQQSTESSRNSGSSPLSRGILAGVDEDQSVVRIIPALAGNTAAAQPVRHPTMDHPRSRGEYLRRRCRVCPRGGSSPLSRGIRWRYRSYKRLYGIIPALAGNTAAYCP